MTKRESKYFRKLRKEKILKYLKRILFKTGSYIEFNSYENAQQAKGAKPIVHYDLGLIPEYVKASLQEKKEKFFSKVMDAIRDNEIILDSGTPPVIPKESSHLIDAMEYFLKYAQVKDQKILPPNLDHFTPID